MSIGNSNKTKLDMFLLFGTAMFGFALMYIFHIGMESLGYSKETQDVIYQVICWIVATVYVPFDWLKRYAIRCRVGFWIGAICIILLYWLLLVKLKYIGIDLVMLSTPMKVVHGVIGVLSIGRLCKSYLMRCTRTQKLNNHKI